MTRGDFFRAAVLAPSAGLIAKMLPKKSGYERVAPPTTVQAGDVFLNNGQWVTNTVTTSTIWYDVKGRSWHSSDVTFDSGGRFTLT